ncbi:universal stress protein [Methylocystis bryophila]|uniref:universal stress protein n=1 Tax=Methylocystis bryophila TaxID=655015 RepID=UPI00131A0B5A|nr:universal stress protein [Methylocystis bryophila]BDV38060.1 universal stress protein UspA [Methylocystis bryophila]
MAIKDLLFHLEPEGPEFPGSEFALSLAQAHGAHLTVASLVIQYPPQLATPASFAGGLEFGDVESVVKFAEEYRKIAREAFAQLSKSLPAGVSAEHRMIESFPQTIGEDCGRLARGFDLSIIPQPSPLGPDYAQDIVTGALFGSARPVIVLPRGFLGPAKLTKAMVCWDGGAPATKALAESLPLLERAEKVEVVCVQDDGQSPGDPNGAEILRHLERHGVAAVLCEIPSAKDEAIALLDRAAESRADFLVMGAYGHWRLRELIFGGTTQRMLAESKLPIFMAH